MGQVAKLQLPSTAHCKNEMPDMPACMPADVQDRMVGQPMAPPWTPGDGTVPGVCQRQTQTIRLQRPLYCTVTAHLTVHAPAGCATHTVYNKLHAHQPIVCWMCCFVHARALSTAAPQGCWPLTARGAAYLRGLNPLLTAQRRGCCWRCCSVGRWVPGSLWRRCLVLAVMLWCLAADHPLVRVGLGAPHSPPTAAPVPVAADKVAHTAPPPAAGGGVRTKSTSVHRELHWCWTNHCALAAANTTMQQRKVLTLPCCTPMGVATRCCIHGSALGVVQQPQLAIGSAQGVKPPLRCVSRPRTPPPPFTHTSQPAV